EILVEGVLDWLAERGYADVETVTAAQESITFSLPKELRRDLRAEAAADGRRHGQAATGRRRGPPVRRP
ncbi:4-hydroxy-3-methylbut-2-enyl diphosphate reductase, partial [Streptomyces sp. NPDC008001]